MTGRRILEIGGIIAGTLMIAFGVGALVMSINARNTVSDEVTAEQIVGSADMNPAAIKVAMTEAGLKNVAAPTCNVADQPIENGSDARCFAQYMRIHALEASGGLTYSQMGRFLAAKDPSNPAGTSDEAAALKDDAGKPVANAARNTWVTETALSTALNVSYMAEQIALFGLIVGIALLLSGIGFIILALIVLGAGATKEVEGSGVQEQRPAPAEPPAWTPPAEPGGRLEAKPNGRSTSRSTKGRRKPPLQRSRSASAISRAERRARGCDDARASDEIERGGRERRLLEQVDRVAALTHEELRRRDVDRPGRLERAHRVDPAGSEVTERQRERAHHPQALRDAEHRRSLLRDESGRGRLEGEDLDRILRPRARQRPPVQAGAATLLRRPTPRGRRSRRRSRR